MKQLNVAIEKIVATYIEAYVTILLLSNTYDYGSANAAAVAAVPAALTAIMALVPQTTTLPYYVDLTFRVLRTWLAGVVGYVVAAPIFSFDVALWKPAAIAAIPAALSLIKGALAAKVGVTSATSPVNEPSAAALPFKADPASEVVSQAA